MFDLCGLVSKCQYGNVHESFNPHIRTIWLLLDSVVTIWFSVEKGVATFDQIINDTIDLKSDFAVSTNMRNKNVWIINNHHSFS